MPYPAISLMMNRKEKRIGDFNGWTALICRRRPVRQQSIRVLQSKPSHPWDGLMLKTIALACLFLSLASQALAQLPITPVNAPRLERVARYGTDEQINASDRSPDGLTLAKGGALGVWLFDSDGMSNPRLLIPTDRPVQYLSYSPDGSLLAYSLGENIHLINPLTGAEIAVFPNDSAYFAFHPTQLWIATVGSVHVEASDNAPAHDAVTIALRDVMTGDIVKQTHLKWANSFDGEINSLAFSSDGKWIAVSYLGAPYDSCGQRAAVVYVWDAETFISGDFRRARQGVEFTPDGKLISLEADYQYFIFDHVALYDPETGVEELIPFDAFHELDRYSEYVSALLRAEPVVMVAPELIAPAGDLPTKYARFYDPLPALRFGPFILAADGSRAAVSLKWDDNRIQAWFAAVWDFSEARFTFSRFHRYGTNNPLVLTHWFSPDLRYLVAEYDGAIDYFLTELYDLAAEDGGIFYENSGVIGDVEGFSPDGTKLILSESRFQGCGGLIAQWIIDIQTGQNIAPLRGSANAFSPNGQLVANDDYFRLTVYDTTTGAMVFQDAAVYAGSPRWTADGSALVVDHHDGTFTVYEVKE